MKLAQASTFVSLLALSPRDLQHRL